LCFFQPKDIPVRQIKKEVALDVEQLQQQQQQLQQLPADKFIVENQLEKSVFHKQPLLAKAEMVRKEKDVSGSGGPVDVPDDIAGQILQSINENATTTTAVDNCRSETPEDTEVGEKRSKTTTPKNKAVRKGRSVSPKEVVRKEKVSPSKNVLRMLANGPSVVQTRRQKKLSDSLKFEKLATETPLTEKPSIETSLTENPLPLSKSNQTSASVALTTSTTKAKANQGNLTC
jgi:hypothetical protein